MTKTCVAVCHKNKRTYNALTRSPTERGLFRFESLLDAGWIRVESYGDENVYFEFTSDEGNTESGYCKCL